MRRTAALSVLAPLLGACAWCAPKYAAPPGVAMRSDTREGGLARRLVLLVGIDTGDKSIQLAESALVRGEVKYAVYEGADTISILVAPSDLEAGRRVLSASPSTGRALFMSDMFVQDPPYLDPGAAMLIDRLAIVASAPGGSEAAHAARDLLAGNGIRAMISVKDGVVRILVLEKDLPRAAELVKGDQVLGALFQDRAR